MRNAALMAAGVVMAVGASFAIAPAFSDGPAYYNSSAHTLGDEDHAVYVERQTDASLGDDTLSRDQTVSDRRYGFEDGVVRDGYWQRETTVAQAGTRTLAPIAEESIDVQARRLPNGAPVAVRGTVTAISGKTMIIERADGRVHARLPGMIEEIKDGDDVTVYGRLANRGGDVAVRTDAVLLMTSMDEGRLFLAPSKLESVNARNPAITRAGARNALDYYRFNFTPL